jgi:hypothetical protein
MSSFHMSLESLHNCQQDLVLRSILAVDNSKTPKETIIFMTEFVVVPRLWHQRFLSGAAFTALSHTILKHLGDSVR